MSITENPVTPWQRTERRMEFLFLGLVVVIALAFLVVASGSSRTNANEGAVSAPALFKGTVSRVVPLSAGAVRVTYSIKNRGGSSGDSNCSIYVHDASGSFPGFFAPISPRTLKANHSSTGSAIVFVGAPGPRYINQGKIDCR